MVAARWTSSSSEDLGSEELKLLTLNRFSLLQQPDTGLVKSKAKPNGKNGRKSMAKVSAVTEEPSPRTSQKAEAGMDDH
eukprot:12935933-Prorocentrum_lima.AAC.1